jgi:hypothetical protein
MSLHGAECRESSHVEFTWHSSEPKRKTTRFMKEWTENDSEAMFRQSSDTSIDDKKPAAVDNSEEARRRRRFPFEGNRPDAADQRRSPLSDDDQGKSE